MRFHQNLALEDLEDKHVATTLILAFFSIISGMFIQMKYVEKLLGDEITGGILIGYLLTGLLGIFLPIISLMHLSRMFYCGIDKFIGKFRNTIRGDRYRFDVNAIFDNTFGNFQFYFSILSVSYWLSVFMRYSLAIHINEYNASSYAKAYFLTYPMALVYGFFGYCLFYIFMNLVFMGLKRFLLFLDGNESYQQSTNHLRERVRAFKKAVNFHIKERILGSVFGACVVFGFSKVILQGTLFGHALAACLFGFGSFALSYCFLSLRKETSKKETVSRPSFKGISEEELVRELNEPVAFPAPLTYQHGSLTQEFQVMVEQVNNQIQRIKPYRAFVTQDDLHILFRMVDNELKPTLHHYMHLPTDVQVSYDTQLHEQLTLLLAESERIYRSAYSYHENGFKKMHRLIENRYQAHQ